MKWMSGVGGSDIHVGGAVGVGGAGGVDGEIYICVGKAVRLLWKHVRVDL